MDEEPSFDHVRQVIERFNARAREEFDERLGKWSTDLAQNEVHEVVGALLARQVTLSCQLASCPMIWNGHVAPLVLRAMADVYITLAWVLREPVDRCRKFIYFGLGQEKLQLEHRRAELEARDALEGEREHIAAIEDWINSQRFTFLTDVNLGSWSGISTRDMADEAGCLDFYNYVYSPFSGCAHSMWQHIARYNLKKCKNPLHRFHAVPDIVDVPLDPNYLYLAGKYLQKTFATFDQVVGTTIDHQSAFDLLCSDLDALGASQSDTAESAG